MTVRSGTAPSRNLLKLVGMGRLTPHTESVIASAAMEGVRLDNSTIHALERIGRGADVDDIVATIIANVERERVTSTS